MVKSVKRDLRIVQDLPRLMSILHILLAQTLDNKNKLSKYNIYKGAYKIELMLKKLETELETTLNDLNEHYDTHRGNLQQQNLGEKK